MHASQVGRLQLPCKSKRRAMARSSRATAPAGQLARSSGRRAAAIGAAHSSSRRKVPQRHCHDDTKDCKKVCSCLVRPTGPQIDNARRTAKAARDHRNIRGRSEGSSVEPRRLPFPIATHSVRILVLRPSPAREKGIAHVAMGRTHRGRKWPMSHRRHSRRGGKATSTKPADETATAPTLQAHRRRLHEPVP